MIILKQLLIGVKVDDILETKLDTMFRLVLDKGTLDAIGLHPDGPIKRYDNFFILKVSMSMLVFFIFFDYYYNYLATPILFLR